MRTFFTNRKGKKTPSGLDLLSSEPFSKINPSSNIDLAVINSQGCFYETKKQEAQHYCSADRRVFNTLARVDNRNEKRETEDRESDAIGAFRLTVLGTYKEELSPGGLPRKLHTFKDHVFCLQSHC